MIDTILSYLTLQVSGISFGCFRENHFLFICSDGGISLTPLATCILVIAISTALLSAFNLWRIAREEDRLVRLEALRGTTPRITRTRRRLRTRGFERLGSVVAASRLVGRAEQQRLLAILNALGIREHGDLARFVASKVYCAIAVSAFGWLLLQWSGWFVGSITMRFAVLLGALMLGWRVPDFVLSRFAAHRRLTIEYGLPTRSISSSFAPRRV
jgi:hypothetical protein